MKGILTKLNFLLDTAIVSSDSQSALLLSKNHVYHERSKHIGVKYHFIWEKIVSSEVKLEKNHID